MDSEMHVGVDPNRQAAVFHTNIKSEYKFLPAIPHPNLSLGSSKLTIGAGKTTLAPQVWQIPIMPSEQLSINYLRK